MFDSATCLLLFCAGCVCVHLQEERVAAAERAPDSALLLILNQSLPRSFWLSNFKHKSKSSKSLGQATCLQVLKAEFIHGTDLISHSTHIPYVQEAHTVHTTCADHCVASFVALVEDTGFPALCWYLNLVAWKRLQRGRRWQAADVSVGGRPALWLWVLDLVMEALQQEAVQAINMFELKWPLHKLVVSVDERKENYTPNHQCCFLPYDEGKLQWVVCITRASA